MKRFSIVVTAIFFAVFGIILSACQPAGTATDKLPAGWSIIENADWTDIVAHGVTRDTPETESLKGMSGKEDTLIPDSPGEGIIADLGGDSPRDELLEMGAPGPPIPGEQTESEEFPDPIVPDEDIVVDPPGMNCIPPEDAWKGPKAGQLTAGEWSDIKNYEYYLSLFKTVSDADEVSGEQRRDGFKQYIGYFGFETRYMFTVFVECSGAPVADATVELYGSSKTALFAAKTDINGNAYLFPSTDLTGKQVTLKAKSGKYETTTKFSYRQGDVKMVLKGTASKAKVLDIMFVIDTTGSMGDELQYINNELEDVINAVSSENPGYIINLAVLFYRDIDDEYVTRYCGFTTDIAKQKHNILQQRAYGGGDFPEAADRALKDAVSKNWSADNATRLIFHICDAPPHSDKTSQKDYQAAIFAAAQKGIRIIPVASSGIDKPTEYLLRQEALLTGGTYLFLTDDSGIGSSHIRPTIGEYAVEYLNAAMVRVINEYLTGAAVEPIPYTWPVIDLEGHGQ